MENNVEMKVRRKHKSKKEAWCINRATSKSTYCYNLDILISRDLPVLVLDGTDQAVSGL